MAEPPSRVDARITRERGFLASLVARMVKNLPAMQEPGFDPSVRKISWRKEMATHSRILAWKSHGQRSLAGYNPWGHKESDTTERLPLPLHTAKSR